MALIPIILALFYGETLRSIVPYCSSLCDLGPVRPWAGEMLAIGHSCINAIVLLFILGSLFMQEWPMSHRPKDKILVIDSGGRLYELVLFFLFKGYTYGEV